MFQRFAHPAAIILSREIVEIDAARGAQIARARLIEAAQGAENSNRFTFGRAEKPAAVFDPDNRMVAAFDFIAAGKPRAGLRALGVGAPKLADARRADTRQVPLGMADLGAVAHTEHLAGVGQPFDRAGAQISIVDGITRRLDSVADDFRIFALGFHALPEQSFEFDPALRWTY